MANFGQQTGYNFTHQILSKTKEAIVLKFSNDDVLQTSSDPKKDGANLWVLYADNITVLENLQKKGKKFIMHSKCKVDEPTGIIPVVKSGIFLSTDSKNFISLRHFEDLNWIIDIILAVKKDTDPSAHVDSFLSECIYRRSFKAFLKDKLQGQVYSMALDITDNTWKQPSKIKNQKNIKEMRKLRLTSDSLIKQWQNYLNQKHCGKEKLV